MSGKWLAALASAWLLAGLPASSNFQLNSYGFGNGGAGNITSSHYSINGIAGEQAGSASSSHFNLGAGENFTKQANVPIIAISNDTGFWYNKLHITIDPQNNPSDALFAVAISTDNFATTEYVHSDLTIGSTLSFSDYQTYAAWGGSSGVIIRGLSPSTVYTVKAKAYRGKFTESPYGPTASAATVSPQLSFDIDVSATDTSTNPPYDVDFGTLPVSTVTDSPVRVWVSLDTNAESGGFVYVDGQNAGLKSASAGYTIAAVTGDLGALAEGFGIQGASVAQTSGGPLALDSPYNGSAGNVGIEDTTIRQVFDTSGQPIVGGRGSFILKAKTKPLTPAAGDYTEVMTAIAAGSF